jgi:hypothetical protein
MAIRKELIDELMATSDRPLIGPDGLSKELMKALVKGGGKIYQCGGAKVSHLAAGF